MDIQTLHILLIDDDEDDFVNIRGLLSEVGLTRYKLIWKSDYAQGMAALEAGSFDACLVDYRLGERTGLDFIDEASRTGITCAMIVLTGYADTDLDLRAMQSGAADYLVKGQISAPLLDRSIRYSLKHALDMKRLADQTESFRTLFNSTFEGIVVLKEGKIVEANAAAGDIFGYTPSDMAQTDLRSFVRPDYYSEFDELLTRKNVQRMEAVGLKRDGAEIFLELSSRTVVLSGEVLSLLAVRDVTQNKQMEAQILQQDRLASLGLLASSLAHEIGTPLGVIRGRAEMVAKAGDEKTRGTMDLIVGQIDRIAKLVNSLLHLARGSKSDTVTNVYLKTVLGDVVNLMSHELQRKNIEFLLSGDTDVGVKAESGPLGQVFLNLMVNAVHAIESATTGARRISVDVHSEPTTISISIRDTGCGISDKNLKHLFQPFFTTKDVGLGTGLGLATSYKLVNSWGGTIGVDSKENQGAAFTITLRRSDP